MAISSSMVKKLPQNCQKVKGDCEIRKLQDARSKTLAKLAAIAVRSLGSLSQLERGNACRSRIPMPHKYLCKRQMIVNQHPSSLTLGSDLAGVDAHVVKPEDVILKF